MNHIDEKHLYTKNSKINGVGLYTSCQIKNGEVAFILKGKKIFFHPTNKDEACKLPNIFGVGKDIYIDPIYPYTCINHSCNPNLACNEDGISYTAIRDIDKDEELTFDYSISEYSDWEMDCNCGTKNCRGVIGSVEKLPVSLFQKYFPLVPEFFQRVFITHYINSNEKSK